MFAISSKSKLEQRLSQISSEKIESGPSYETVRDNVRPIAQEKLQQQLGAGFDRHMARAKAKNIIIDLLELHGSHFPKPMQLSMAEELVDDLLGYGPLEVLMNDPDITEIKVVHWNEIWIEKNGVERELQTAFRNEQHCREVLDRLLAASGKSIDYSRPYTSARLKDGSRVQATIPPIGVDGTDFSIRRFLGGMKPEVLIERKMFNEESMQFIRACVEGALNIIVSGGTSSGKTTVIGAILSFVPYGESMILIENPAELIVHNKNVRRWETKEANIEGKGSVTMRKLVANALRAAPKRIIIGEIREGEAFDMVQAMNTGHPGSFTSIHANSARDALNERLPVLMQMAEGVSISNETCMRMIASTIDIVIHIQKDRDGVRRMTQIVQVIGTQKDPKSDSIIVQTEDLFKYSHNKKDWVKTTAEFKFAERLQARGVDFTW